MCAFLSTRRRMPSAFITLVTKFSSPKSRFDYSITEDQLRGLIFNPALKLRKDAETRMGLITLLEQHSKFRNRPFAEALGNRPICIQVPSELKLEATVVLMQKLQSTNTLLRPEFSNLNKT